mmetsp:Transcript_115474/g.331449  ORF Transcript_115474/g.331449 Transcript_115474/m.331449 type:complete len:221 (-) Transcript_115474:868-1530(-)
MHAEGSNHSSSSSTTSKVAPEACRPMRSKRPPAVCTARMGVCFGSRSRNVFFTWISDLSKLMGWTSPYSFQRRSASACGSTAACSCGVSCKRFSKEAEGDAAWACATGDMSSSMSAEASIRHREFELNDSRVRALMCLGSFSKPWLIAAFAGKAAVPGASAAAARAEACGCDGTGMCIIGGPVAGQAAARSAKAGTAKACACGANCGEVSGTPKPTPAPG